MKKREFLKTLGKGSLAIVSSHTLLQACIPKETGSTVSEVKNLSPNTKNWTWVTPEKGLSADQWKRKLSLVKDSGIDAILLEVYNGNHTYYDNNRLPVEEKLLEKLVPICKELGLEFHAWMWTMPCNNEKIVKEHPDWYAVNGLGQSAATHPAYVDYYKFLCPCHPEAQEFVRQNVEALAQINDIDGVHLDYVRLPDVILAEALQPKYDIIQDREYPQYDYCYSQYCRDQFKKKTGIDPLKDLKDPSANQEWRQFRYDAITNLVNNKLVPEAKKYNKKVTAAVFPNWESVRQQWGNWHLDAYLPMLYHNFYNEDINWIREHTEKGIARLQDKKPVYSGLYIPSLSPKELQQAYEAALQGGAGGISIFSMNQVSEEHWRALAEVAAKS
ncbi:Tat (twin-arginine translocation) pathway signal sequence domain protein [Fulvivirga imtechensis AK7]|uniref:Tat (Twin-arginine translocation) pathway signal sequence domain protein n=1 Tax=Fulvivirga imtechensis AK7 TaxID=1237149 RepID=L8JWZ0_9BACT|nr:family 10 glycosylhydrolase [Fulvivirga imtechensis]ELR72144.1 Tat (twin-arginine translocation) pathway signal sequence domain protein [Fulvivirga imtechensis AK7]